MGRFHLIAAASALGLALSLMPGLAADTDMASKAPAGITMTEEGPIFVTPSGMALYMMPADDATPGRSSCTNVPRTSIKDPTAGFGELPLPKAEVQKSCVQKWPPFMAEANAAPSGEWSLIDRPDGGKQWAYRGHPLYTSIKDHKPGDIFGGAGTAIAGGNRGFRLAMAPVRFPPGLKFIHVEEGLVLATVDDRPVYTPHDKNVQKACEGCAELYKPMTAPALANVSGDWSIVDAGAGRRQYAYKGQALYAAPASLTNSEIADSGGWDLVVYQKAAGTPSEIEKRFSLAGEVYTDKAGKTLYTFSCGVTITGDGVRCDDPGDAATYWVAICGDAKECSRRWRPYLAAEGAKPVGDWSIVEVADPIFTDPQGFTYPADAPRVKAWANRGRPVYTYYEDKGPGDIWGHSIRWFAYSGFYAVQVPGHGVLD